MKTRILSMGLVVLAIFAASQPSFAQVYGAGYQNLINTFVTNKIWEMTLNNPKKGGKPSSGSAGSTSTTPSTVPDYGGVVSSTAVTPEQVRRASQFKPTGTRLSLDEYVEALGGTWTAQEKAETKARLTEFLNKFDANAAALGYPNDIPLALVTQVVVNSAVYYDKPILSNDEILGARNSLAIELTRSGAFDKANDQQKQGIYEFSLMDAGLLQYFYEKAKKEKNAEELKMSKVVAKDRLNRFGIEVQ